MTTLHLPSSPTIGSSYVAANGVTYTWVGYWSSSIAVQNGIAVPYYEGGDSSTWSTADQTNPGDSVLDGGNSLGQ